MKKHHPSKLSNGKKFSPPISFPSSIKNEFLSLEKSSTSLFSAINFARTKNSSAKKEPITQFFIHRTQVMYSCGMPVVYIVGLMTSWRVLALFGIIPCLIQFSGTFFIPESPRWLVKVGRNKDCEAALQRLRGQDADTSPEVAAIKEYNKCAHSNSGGNFFDVIHLKYAYALTVSLRLMAVGAFGGTSGIFSYATEIFESAGLGTIAMALLQVLQHYRKTFTG